MVDLVATGAFGTSLPVTVGALTLGEWPIGDAHLIAPFRDRTDAVSEALAPYGLRFPAPGESLTAEGGARIDWAGRGRALYSGPLPDLAGLAAVTEAASGLAACRLEGPGAELALNHLVPIDLSPEAFPEGRTARTLLGHMSVSLSREGPEAFGLLAMRSMAGTLVHELTRAMRQSSARPPFGLS